jgi:hypothetical protein
VRSFAEIRFRLFQEAVNLRLLLAPPAQDLPPPAAPLNGLPDPRPVAARLQGSAWARELEQLAHTILAGRTPLFEREVATGADIDWTRDYVHAMDNRRFDRTYFRRIPYLDFSVIGDHKMIWELNRHQHLVVLAQAALLTGRAEFIAEIERQLDSWLRQNLFQRGLNWTSALEVAFRAWSWIWVYHLVGEHLSPTLRSGLMTELYRHGRHLRHNLSVYFSPNTHLLGEAVVLHALGRLFPDWPEAGAWRAHGRDMVRRQMNDQVFADGSHYEQSTYYHLYAVDFFLIHHLLEPAPPDYQAQLRHMIHYLNAFLSPEGQLMPIGDDDGGRLFHPYGPRQGFARATLATCACVFPDAGWPVASEELPVQAVWWLGESALAEASFLRPMASELFADSGLAVMNSSDGRVRVLVDAGPFGRGGAGHSHADTLSIVAWRGGEEILIDPGSYTYVADPAWRNRFRGTAAHNTVCVDGADQGVAAGPFRWAQKPEVERHVWRSSATHDYLDASCRGGEVRHRRRVLFLKDHGWLFVIDEAEELPGAAPGRVRLIEQYWHLADRTAGARLHHPAALTGEWLEGGEVGWRSLVLGTKVAAPVWRIRRSGPLPATLAMVVDLGVEAPSDDPGEVTWEQGTLRWEGRIEIRWEDEADEPGWTLLAE